MHLYACSNNEKNQQKIWELVWESIANTVNAFSADCNFKKVVHMYIT